MKRLSHIFLSIIFLFVLAPLCFGSEHVRSGNIPSKEDILSEQSVLRSFIDRVCGEGMSGRILIGTDSSIESDGRDVFVISSRDGKPEIVGSGVSAATAGLGWYLNHYVHVNISWNGLTADLRDTVLPLPEIPERRECRAEWRYYLNYCTYSYTCAFWTEERWMKEVDWMALHGINMPLMALGTDVVWRNVLRDLGCDETEISSFITGPGFQAWWMMGNIEGWGGPLPQGWYDRQERLCRRVLARMRSLGMEPVLPGYCGMLPRSFIGKPGYDASDTGLWAAFPRPTFLQPSSVKFASVADLYYEEQAKIMGRSRFYSMDPFHEGGSVEGTDIPEAYRTILARLRRHNPDAVWVLQGWNENPRREALEALGQGDCIVFDLFSEARPKWRDGYCGHDMIWCMLPNFGGRVGLHGRLSKLLNGWFDAVEAFPETMVGIGAAPEGIETNPVLYDLLFELPWRTGQRPATRPTSAENVATNGNSDCGRDRSCREWLDGYVLARYGTSDPSLIRAWHKIAASALDCPTDQEGTSEPIVCARPGWGLKSVSKWSTAEIYYDVAELRDAAGLFLDAKTQLSGNANYRHDLIDLVRQTLTDSTLFLLRNVEAAYKSGDTAAFRSGYKAFLGMIDDIDALLSTDPFFHLDRWLDSAEEVCGEITGATDADRALMERNARTLITVWGDRPSARGLHDYSNREWGGMLSSFYLPRWKRFFETVERGEALPDDDGWYEIESEWILRRERYALSDEPALDCAERLFRKYFGGCFELTASSDVTALSDEAGDYVAYLKEFLAGTEKPSADAIKESRIVLDIDGGLECGPEGFEFAVRPGELRITGRDRAGVFYGIQHLLRQLPPSVYAKQGLSEPVQLPLGVSLDAPESTYRGLMIDVARAFVDAEGLKRQIDLMGMHNLNVLHLHLTDNEGWRLEIKSHPELAEVGGFRGGDSSVGAQYGLWDRRYGGCYTQEQMREIIAYAKFRNITIIPEIDLPGHSQAIARVLPEILCDYAPDTSRSAGYDTRGVWCVSREENYRLLDDIISEVAALFPSEHIHIGGDEVGMKGWLSCPHCSALMREMGFTDPKQLEDLFMKRVTDIVKAKGKTPVAWWDKDVITDTFTKESLVCAWQDIPACRNAMAKGYRTVFMSAWHLYFDMKQGPHDPGQDWGGIIDWHRVYDLDLGRLGVTDAEKSVVIGYEGAFWAETHLQNAPESPDHLDFMLWPRAAALGAMSWGKKLSGEEFAEYMRTRHYPRLSAMGVAFRLPEPSVTWGNGLLSASAEDGETILCIKNGGSPKAYYRPFKTAHPESYSFVVRFGSGRSVPVKARQCYDTIAPAFRLSSSMPEDGWKPFSGVEAYRDKAHFSSTPHDGDWILIDFSNPVKCREIALKTGEAHFASGGFPYGYTEVSYDGKHFHRVGELIDGGVSIFPKRPVRSVRLVCTFTGNSRDLTILQPIRVYPVLTE